MRVWAFVKKSADVHLSGQTQTLDVISMIKKKKKKEKTLLKDSRMKPDKRRTDANGTGQKCRTETAPTTNEVDEAASSA